MFGILNNNPGIVAVAIFLSLISAAGALLAYSSDIVDHFIETKGILTQKKLGDDVRKIVMNEGLNLPDGAIVISEVACSDLSGKWQRFESANGRVLVGVGGSKDASGMEKVFGVNQDEGVYETIFSDVASHQHGAGDIAVTIPDTMFQYPYTEKVVFQRLPDGSSNVPGVLIGSRPNLDSQNWGGGTYKTSGSTSTEGVQQIRLTNMPPYKVVYFCKKIS